MKRPSLRIQLLLPVLLAILPMFGLMLFSNMERRQARVAEARREASQLVALISNEHGALMGEAHQLLTGLAHLPEVRNRDSAACSALFAQILAQFPRYTDIGAIDPDGNLFCSALPATAPLNLATRPYFQRVLERRDFASGDYQIGAISAKPVLVFAEPYLDPAGEVKAVVFAALDLEWLNHYAATAQLPPGSTIVLIDRQGAILAHHPASDRWVGQPMPEAPVVQAMLTHKQGTMMLPGLDGVESLFVFAPLGGNADAYIGVSIPEEVMLARAERAFRRDLAVLALVGLLSTAAAWVGARILILRPVKALSRAARELSAGNLQTRSSLAYVDDELGQLARTFDTMAARLNQRDAERRQRAEEMARARDFYLKLLDEFPNPIWRASADARCDYFNQAWLDLTGRTLEQEIGDGWAEGVHPDDLARCLKTYLTAFEAREPFVMEYRLRATDGDYRWILDYGRPLYDLDGRFAGYIGSCYDFTDRKRAQEMLERYRLLSEHARDIILFVDGDGRIVEANNAAAAAYGYERQELLALHLRDLRTELRTQKDEQESSAWVDGILAESVHHRKDGTTFPVEASTRGALIDGRRVFLSVIRDISERRRLEEQFLHAQKMQTIGRLAGGVAHEFNNLLTAIIGYADSARYALPVTSHAYEDIGQVLKASERAANLTRQLLAFSRRQIMQPIALDLNRLLQDMDGVLRRLIHGGIEVLTLPSPDLGLVRADPSQLGQVIINVAVNARDAMPQGGCLTIRTENVELDDEFLRTHPGAVAGQFVKLTISDTGIGMTEEVKAHLFEPFFTTKGVGAGTGLGLAAVFGIIKQHHGNIWVQSEPGQGTSIEVYLPRITEAVQVPLGSPVATLLGGQETILIVEDEPVVRGLVVRILRGLGYQVLEAGNGHEALALAAEHQGDIHLLLTDGVMPQMSGDALANKLRSVRPNTQVIFLSGYADDTPAEIVAGFLQTPFTMEALAHKVREMLSGPHGQAN